MVDELRRITEVIECPVCGEFYDTDLQYCPNCRAKRPDRET